MMNNIALIVKLRELLVIFMHTRSLPEKAADALRYCQEHLPIAEIPIGAYGEYSDIFEQIVFLSDDKSRTAPDDLLRSGGDLILSILMLYEQVASYIAVEEFMQNRTALTNSALPQKNASGRRARWRSAFSDGRKSRHHKF
jgi:hypothetical protein